MADECRAGCSKDGCEIRAAAGVGWENGHAKGSRVAKIQFVNLNISGNRGRLSQCEPWPGLAGHECGCFRIVVEPLRVRIPLHLATQHQRDVGKMAGRHRAMVGFDIGNRFAPVGHALEEVAHVIARPAAFVERYQRLEQHAVFREAHVFDQLAGDAAAVDEDAALGTDKQNAVTELGLAFFVLAAQRHRCTVGILKFYIESRNRVVGVG